MNENLIIDSVAIEKAVYQKYLESKGPVSVNAPPLILRTT